jgi:Ran GTPase-activating protein (RanGAP) involved in mRNA processing and transport
MKRKKKKIVKKQLVSLKGKIEKYLTKDEYYDLFNKSKISLHISKIESEGINIFAKLIEKNFISVPELNFSSSYEYGKVDLEKLQTLAYSLERNTIITTLNFSKNHICEKGLTYFARIIAKNATITDLDLSLNNNGFISSKKSGLDDFGLSLQINKTLSILNFSYNSLRKAGTEKIIRGLKNNTSIKELNLSVNIIGDEGAECIKALLSTNKTLTKLDISGNAFTDTGISKIAEGLAKNETLNTLDLSLNRITDQGVETIIKSLESNTTLTKLDLSYNEIRNKGAGFILLFIKDHPTIYVEIAHNENISEFFRNAIALKNNSNKKLKAEAEIATTKTIIKKPLEKYQPTPLDKPLEKIEEDRQDYEVTFHTDSNKDIFLTDVELPLELISSYDSELPALMQ